MIVKEYGKYVGACDLCGETTPKFDTWFECRDYLRSHWGSERDEDTGEWWNLCPACNQDQ